MTIAPVTGITPLYGLEYPEEGEGAWVIRQKWERMVLAVEAALAAGGIAPPDVADLLALAADVGALTPKVNLHESPTYARVIAPSAGNPGASQPVAANNYAVINFAAPAAADDLAGFWNAAAPQRLTCPGGKGGLYKVSGLGGFVPGAGQHHVELRKNGSVVPGAVASGGGLAALNHLLPLPAENLVRLVPTDYLQLALYSDTATAAATTAGQVCALQLTRFAA